MSRTKIPVTASVRTGSAINTCKYLALGQPCCITSRLLASFPALASNPKRDYIYEVLPISLAKIVQECGFTCVGIEEDEILNSDSVPSYQSPFHIQLVGFLPHGVFLQGIENRSFLTVCTSLFLGRNFCTRKRKPCPTQSLGTKKPNHDIFLTKALQIGSLLDNHFDSVLFL